MGVMIFLIIFDSIGAIFNFWQYKDTEYKGFLIPFALYLIALLLSIVSIAIR